MESQKGRPRQPTQNNMWLQLVLAVPRPRAPAALHGIEFDAARAARLSHRASGWTLNAIGCPAGQRNAAASECLTAVQEAAQLAGVEVLDIGLSAVNHGHGAGVPSGCSYNTASKAAIFNSNAAVTSGKEKYQRACIEEPDELPRDCAARLFLYPSAAFAYGVYDNNVTSLNNSDFEETSELIARYAEQLQGEEVEVELPFEQPGPLWIARGGSLQMDELFSTAWRDGEEEAVHRVRSYADGRSVAKVDIEDTPDQFKAGALAHYRLLTHPCRTDDPAEADLFFYAIPRGYKPDAAHCKRQGAELELLKQRFQDERGNLSYMERHGGRDHFTVLGRSAWDFDTCNETHGLGSALGEAFRVSVDGGRP